jgi:hypothetical protein
MVDVASWIAEAKADPGAYLDELEGAWAEPWPPSIGCWMSWRPSEGFG